MKVFRPAAAIAGKNGRTLACRPARVVPRSSASTKIVHMDNINKNVVEMEYAVRGAVPMRAGKIMEEIAAGKKYPFDEVLYCNIGNPHSVGQQPLSFYREVMAIVDCPQLLQNPQVGSMFKEDVIARAKLLISEVAGGTGAYSGSQGVLHIRKVPRQSLGRSRQNPDDIFICNGASDAIQKILTTIISGPKDGILVPIPQYPIYSALIKLLNGELVGYFMDEGKGWGLDLPHLKQEIASARAKGTLPKALVIINPGNPVGNVLSEADMVALIKLCKEERLILLSDEVYQENTYTDRPFLSAKKVVRSLGKEFDDFELISFHSTSKGMIGECGRRGGYMEICGMDTKVVQQIYKLASSGLCSNLNGQIMCDLMLAPPKKGDASYESFRAEYDGIYNGLKRKSQMLYKALNAIDGITCQPLAGAMYAFPNIDIPAK
ncbi:pyridoxal phosphate-dependent transferase, partial [Baffinella frigidus]